MINKIKEFLKQWLFEEEIKQISQLASSIRALNSMILHNEDLIKSFLATCQTCYDLSDMNFNEIRDFEKHLESLNNKRDMHYRHIDAPMGTKDYFMFG